MEDDHELAGVVTAEEAREILSRFNASHWRNGEERARYSIPADPKRDDDIRLSAFIASTERIITAADALADALTSAVNADECAPWPAVHAALRAYRAARGTR